MNLQQLRQTAQALFAGDKGLLAMDESTGTCNRRFAALAIPQTVEARRDYRDLIVTAPGLATPSVAPSWPTRPFDSRKKMALRSSKSSSRPESFPGLKWTPVPRNWPAIPARK